MNAHPEICSPGVIESYLEDRLDPEQESRLLQHLATCEICRQQLQLAAAEPSAWSEAEEFLRDQPCDVVSFGSSADSFHDERDVGNNRKASASAEVAQVLSMLNATDDPAMLGRIGGYEVSGVVGSGGMGIVLKAFDRPLDRTVAIKVLAPRLASSGAARRRFAREAKAAATVLHPNVIVIHGVSNDGALPFLVMPYLRGESLQRRLDRQGPLPTEEIVRIAQQVASGLAAAHGQGLVHRDIKPANILLEDGVERVTLTDFGLARAVDDASMTRSGIIAGTPQYMSPEQARGDNVDARSDLYAVGALGYFLLTGQPVFEAETLIQLCQMHIDAVPVPPSQRTKQAISPELEAALLRCLDKVRTRRPNTARELAHLLTEVPARGDWPEATAEEWWNGHENGTVPVISTNPGPADSPYSHTVVDQSKV